VVIDDPNVVRLIVDPAKNDSPLLVHAKTVETLPVSLERLKIVSGWGAKIQQRLSSIQNIELPQATGNKIRRISASLARSTAVIKVVSPRIPE
jgi:hypothetical protein